MDEAVGLLIVKIHETSISWDAVSGTDTVCFGGDPAATQADKEGVIDGLLGRFPNADLEILINGVRLTGQGRKD
jgi:hypothetical protein